MYGLKLQRDFNILLVKKTQQTELFPALFGPLCLDVG